MMLTSSAILNPTFITGFIMNKMKEITIWQIFVMTPYAESKKQKMILLCELELSYK